MMSPYCRPLSYHHTLSRPVAPARLSRWHHVARGLSGRRRLGRWSGGAGCTLQDHSTAHEGTVRLRGERTVIYWRPVRTAGLARVARSGRRLGENGTAGQYRNQGNETNLAHGRFPLRCVVVLHRIRNSITVWNNGNSPTRRVPTPATRTSGSSRWKSSATDRR